MATAMPGRGKAQRRIGATGPRTAASTSGAAPVHDPVHDRVGVRELKAKLSEHLARVKRGESLTVTEHGKPVARIFPYKPTSRERFDQLLEAGVLTGGRGIGSEIAADFGPRPTVKGGSLSDLLIADRKR